MGPAPSAPYFWVVLWLSSLCLGACFYHNFQEAQGLGHHTYSRFSEVQRECNSILSSLSVVKLDHDIPSKMNLYGEWAQDSNDAPLMPLYMGPTTILPGPPSSFPSVTERNKVTKDGFLMFEGYSRLQIAFEGVYSESEADGERVMCLLGSAELPSRGYDPADPWKLRNGSDRRVDPIPLLKDEKIVLVVRRPKGDEESSRQVNPGYFGKMQIAFQPERYPTTTYKFASEDITAKDCSPYARPNKWLGDHINIYKGPNSVKFYISLHTTKYSLCCRTGDATPQMITAGRCGHFDRGTSMRLMGALTGEGRPQRSNISARVATLLKEVLPLESHYEASECSESLSSDCFIRGIWNSSSGQLCMVACAGADSSRCNLRICLYVPTSFSLTQRSTVFGSISSISKSGDPSNFSFSLGRRPIHAYGRQLTMDLTYVLSYEYSKTKQAAEFLRRDEALGHGGGIKKALLTYPRMNERGNLCRDLGLSVSLFPVQRSGRFRVEYVRLRILTLGSKFCDSGFYQSSGNSSDDPAQAAASRLNISAQLEITKTPRNSSLMLSVEGLYSQLTGRCTWSAAESPLLRLRSSIRLRLFRWLITPTAKLSIESNRSKDNDPLYFGPVKLQTSAIMYLLDFNDVNRHRMHTEPAVLYQGRKCRCPYVSHVMLGVQALGNGLSLITGAEALFTSQSQRSYASSSQYDLGVTGHSKLGSFMVKSLVLTAFLLTLRLWQKVWSRATGYQTVPQVQVRGIKDWGARLEQYAGLVQDFFLIPQVIGNIVWQIRCRPLRKAYYLGITLIKLLPMLTTTLDEMRQPMGNQRMLWLGLGRLWSPASGGYDKVASMLSESELVAGAMEIETPAK
ncbi:unnamed protein product [Spirodela intermedia]|uniref:RING-type E3 ubiquitin transferase n=1 Tax=Spirodela intermedia TaxID=51605 RepID=A0A7I8J1W9_SPIIN|nr:unnamed protein product [Spirodela intermedia]CAA6664059.1 unnamed protein product [Spirodela intermedia]